jgi:hypothetical protein
MNSKKKHEPTDPDEIRLIQQCKQLGAEVTSLYDFVPLSYRENVKITRPIVEMLLAEVDTVSQRNIRSVIYQAVSIPDFHDIVFPFLVNASLDEGNNVPKDFIFNDIESIALKSDAEAVGKLLLDRRAGKSRSLLIPLFAKLAKKNAIPVLLKCVGDPATRTYALKHLSMLGDISIEPDLIELAKSENSFFRKTARDALVRVKKNKEKLGIQHTLN